MSGRRAVSLFVLIAAAAAAVPAHAQRAVVPVRRGDAQMTSDAAQMRQAMVREGTGDFAGAEQIVRAVLASSPGSLMALVTLERLLEKQGRKPDVLPAVGRLLEQDPTSVVGHQMRLRIHHETNEPDRLANAIAVWVRATPHLETPYREGAALWRERSEYARAIELLEQGRVRIDMPDALALELGDTHAANGDWQNAAAEWARAVGDDGRGSMLVQRRLQQLADGGAAIIPLLVDELTGEPVTGARRKAATLLAIEAGLETRAQQLSRDLVAAARMQDREPLLIELARRADGSGLHQLAVWAYSELLDGVGEAGATLAIRMRIAELALLAGDTALAAETYRRLEHAAAVGSPQRRQAIALRIQLTARDGEISAATADYAAFRREYPEAAELDETANVLALRHLKIGDDAAAERVLDGVDGPLSALMRGRLLMRRGDIEAARDQLLRAAPLLHGAEATETIALAALLTRISPAGGELIAGVSAAPDAERPALIRAAATAAEGMPPEERSAILDFLAGIADRSGMFEDADALRRAIVAELPRSLEAPLALLALAFRASRQPGQEAQARLLLERLIVEYPRSALSPRARSELHRIGRSTQTRDQPEGS